MQLFIDGSSVSPSVLNVTSAFSSFDTIHEVGPHCPPEIDRYLTELIGKLRDGNKREMP